MGRRSGLGYGKNQMYRRVVPEELVTLMLWYPRVFLIFAVLGW